MQLVQEQNDGFVTIGEFTTYVKETVFPQSLKELEALTQPEDVRVWRQQLIRELGKKLVKGESYKEAIQADVAPQDFEEIKEDLGFATHIFYEATRVADEYKLKEKEMASQTLELK